MKSFRILSLPLLLAAGCGNPTMSSQQGGAFPANAVVARVTEETVIDDLSVIATLEPRNDVVLVSELDAPVKAILFEEGSPVTEGQELIALDETQTRAQLAEAKAAYQLAKVTRDRNKQLLANDTISQQEFDQAESSYLDAEARFTRAEDNQSKTVVRAPFDGVVGERLVSPGQFVSRGEPLTSVVQQDPLEIVFQVPERNLARLEKGMKVSFIPDAEGEDTFVGSVTFIDTSVNPNTRTIKVKAELNNGDGQLKPGMFGNAQLVLAERENATTIPESSILFMQGQPMVVTVDENGISGFQPVTIGRRMNSRAEILEGLHAGQLVVVEGHQKMGPGMKVIAAPESESHGVTPGPLFSEEQPAQPSGETHEAS